MVERHVHKGEIGNKETPSQRQGPNVNSGLGWTSQGRLKE